ncbi:MAG: Rieske 2Fe-2S domain-containing protein [Alphaproteobacteria bacterium]|nr:Rieske 2Fe-2S domain-containing protein [Alphaproteobacteria bacterium]
MREIYVAQADEIADRDRKVVIDDDLEIGVFRLGDEYYAWESNCPHMGGPICQGKIMNRVDEVLDEERRSKGFRFVDEDVHVVCPWHGFEFNIRTGAHPGDANTRLNGFEVELRDGAVYVRV